MSKSEHSTPSSKPRRPEDWSAEERLRAVLESSRLSGEELGAYMRREGLYEATLQEWREAALEGLTPARKALSNAAQGQKRVRELERELRRKDRALAEAAALLVLQKKVRELWGDADSDTELKRDE
jgi:transposase-like protein